MDQRTAATDTFVHTQDLPETDVLSAPDYAAHQGGFAGAGSASNQFHAAKKRRIFTVA